MVALTILSVFFMDDKRYEVRIKTEVSEAMSILSDEYWEAINLKINSRFNQYYYESRLYERISDMF